jgi:hypothetical protein
LAHGADFLYSGGFVAVQMAIEHGDLLLFGRSQLNEQHGLLASVFPADGDGSHAVRVLIQAVGGKLKIRAPQGRLFGRHQSKRLGEDGDPTRTLLAESSRPDDVSQLHLALHRDAGNLPCKMEEIANEPALGRQIQRHASLACIHGVSLLQMTGQ